MRKSTGEEFTEKELRIMRDRPIPFGYGSWESFFRSQKGESNQRANIDTGLPLRNGGD